MQQPSGKGEKKGSATGDSAKTKEIVNHKVKRSLITDNQKKKKEFFIIIKYIKKQNSILDLHPSPRKASLL